MKFCKWFWAFPVASAVHATCMMAAHLFLHLLDQQLVVLMVMVLFPFIGMMNVVSIVGLMAFPRFLPALPDTLQFGACVVAGEVPGSTFSVALKSLVQHFTSAEELLSRMWTLEVASSVSGLARLMTCDGDLHLRSHFWACRPWTCLMTFLPQVPQHTFLVAHCHGHCFLTHGFEPLPWFWTCCMAGLVFTTLLVAVSDRHHTCTHCMVEALPAPLCRLLLVMEIPMLIMLLVLRLRSMMMRAMLMDEMSNMMHHLSDQLSTAWDSLLF